MFLINLALRNLMWSLAHKICRQWVFRRHQDNRQSRGEDFVWRKGGGREARWKLCLPDFGRDRWQRTDRQGGTFRSHPLSNQVQNLGWSHKAQQWCSSGVKQLDVYQEPTEPVQMDWTFGVRLWDHELQHWTIWSWNWRYLWDLNTFFKIYYRCVWRRKGDWRWSRIRIGFMETIYEEIDLHD